MPNIGRTQATQAFYKQQGFRAHPFPQWRADFEKAEKLWSYFVQEDLPELIGELDNPNHHILFGKRGSGKTATRKILSYYLRYLAETPVLVVEFDQNKFRALIKKVTEEGTNATWLYENAVLDAVHKALADEKRNFSLNQTILHTAFPATLEKLGDYLAQAGIAVTYVLVDGVEDVPDLKRKPKKQANLIKPFLENLTVLGNESILYKVFLSSELKNFIEEEVYNEVFDLYKELEWNKDKFLALLDGRMTHFSIDGSRQLPFQHFFGSFRFPDLSDDLASYETPREVIIFAKNLFEELALASINSNPDEALALPVEKILEAARSKSKKTISQNQSILEKFEAEKRPIPSPPDVLTPELTERKVAITPMNEQRIKDLQGLIADANKLKNKLQEQYYVESNSQERAKLNLQIKRLNDDIQNFVQELESLGGKIELPSDPTPEPVSASTNLPLPSSILPVPSPQSVSSYSVLFLGYSPNEDPLDIEAEKRAIAQIFNTKGGRPRPNFDFSAPAELVKERIVKHLLDYQPNILHFSCHGTSDGELVVLGLDGRRAYLPTSELAQKIGSFQDNFGTIRGIILNACYSEEIGRQLVEKVDFVVGSIRTISNKLAVAFSQEFYEYIYAGSNLEQAFNAGKGAVQQDILRISYRPGINPQDIWFR